MLLEYVTVPVWEMQGNEDVSLSQETRCCGSWIEGNLDLYLPILSQQRNLPCRILKSGLPLLSSLLGKFIPFCSYIPSITTQTETVSESFFQMQPFQIFGGQHTYVFLWSLFFFFLFQHSSTGFSSVLSYVCFSLFLICIYLTLTGLSYSTRDPLLPRGL